MRVTSVTFNHLHNRSSHDKVKAYAKIILDEELIITGVKVIVTDTKRFIVFPEEKINPSKTRGEHIVVSLVNPIKSELRNHITESVFEKFDNDPFNPANKHIPSETQDSIEMILKRKLMFYIENNKIGPITVDTGISIEWIQNESKMDEIKAFIDEFNMKYTDATYTIAYPGGATTNLPNLMIIVTPTL